MIVRIVCALAVVLAATLGEPVAHASPNDEPQSVRPVRAPVAVDHDDAAIVLAFGDALGALHDALAYELADRDTRRVNRACDSVVAAHPQLRDSLGDAGADLLVAAHSMVDACRLGFAATLDAGGFEIIDGDYYKYRELSFAYAD